MLGPNLQITTENRISKKGSEAARFAFLATKDMKVGASEEEGLLSLGQVIPPLPSLPISSEGSAFRAPLRVNGKRVLQMKTCNAYY